MRPAFAALEHPALGDPAVERPDSASPGCGPHRVTPFRVPTLRQGTPVAISALRAARHQNITHNHHSFLHGCHSLPFLSTGRPGDDGA
ncbi:MAG: hypothetical protein ACREOY_07055 [Candidatus Dormibacteraceae bacterium]